MLRGIPWAPVLILILFLVFGLFGNFLTPHDPLKTDLRAVKKPPFFQQEGDFKHLLGTDNIGRDILSRIIVGAGVSLQVGFVVVVFAGALGAIDRPALGLSGGMGGYDSDADNGYVFIHALSDHRHRPGRCLGAKQE